MHRTCTNNNKKKNKDKKRQLHEYFIYIWKRDDLLYIFFHYTYNDIYLLTLYI